MRTRSCLLLVLFLGLGQTQASDIYRWVDESGRTHLSDVVPDRYKDTATRIDSRQYELTPEQQREAEQRVDLEKARARDDKVAPSAVQEAPAPPLSTPPVKRPVERVTASSDCATRWRLYRESEACFGPFRTVGGGIKPEAFDHCNEIASPEGQCGPYRD
ncbi:DUF4124 domain-containing protein [Hydrogenophaga sp.]|uniref:DUF4124 domain-containing protein n=1 Tax=Hydrogenophaga sp. TaxID=1904254 RepID=UPI0027260EF2|nr:DUF4124 domain-containing protein [Hydrogenophaga sp.]MDO8903772.1 DUF4124 domain-containing protein [Hydrogenophaga sp.]